MKFKMIQEPLRYEPHRMCFFLLIVLVSSFGCNNSREEKQENKSKPNILFAISDDQSYPHASIYGFPEIQTPVFDTLAREGISFSNAFAAAPQCSPSRAAILTGRNIWQLEEAGTHGSLFPNKFSVFTDALEDGGYAIGYTGKAWGPGEWKQGGWQRNPAGPEFNMHQLESVPFTGIKKVDYVTNFKSFLKKKDKDQPFFFWFGCHEPHRDYELNSGISSGKSPEKVVLPGFLPDDEILRNDVLDYLVEIEWFDQKLGEMIEYLKEIGEYESTIIVVTSDNGMPFPYAKANLQEYGTHVPLVISGSKYVKANRIEEALVSLIDLAPTFLELAQIPLFGGITGKSLIPLIQEDREANDENQRDFVFTGRERHTHARPDNLGYPARAIRTKEFLYIKNYKPDRWPAGDPPPENKSIELDNSDFKPIGMGYNDIDPSPSKTFMIDNKETYQELFDLEFNKRPREELYDIVKDPACIHNLVNNPEYSSIRESLQLKLEKELEAEGDPRLLGSEDVFESYPRFGKMRNFPGFKERGHYNLEYAK